MCKSSVELGLVYKTFINKTLEKLHCCPGKTNYIHCSRNAGLFWEAEQGYLSLNQKHSSLETFFPSESRAALPDEACWLAALAPVDACRGVFFREKCPYKEFHRRLRHQEQRSKKTLRNLYEPEVRFLAQKYSVIRPIFFKLCPCLAWESNSLPV